MKNIILLFVLIMIAGCAQKVPSPSSDLNALLVIPHEGGIKKGKHGFGFHYTFSLIDEVGTEYFIGFSPSSPSRDKKLIIIETLPPGKYRFQYCMENSYSSHALAERTQIEI